eukprot:887812-Prorocentrum_minimum.AAC.1
MVAVAPRHLLNDVIMTAVAVGGDYLAMHPSIRVLTWWFWECVIPGRTDGQRVELLERLANKRLGVNVAHSVTLRIPLDVFNILLERDYSIEAMRSAFIQHAHRGRRSLLEDAIMPKNNCNSSDIGGDIVRPTVAGGPGSFSRGDGHVPCDGSGLRVGGGLAVSPGISRPPPTPGPPPLP